MMAGHYSVSHAGVGACGCHKWTHVIFFLEPEKGVIFVTKKVCVQIHKKPVLGQLPWWPALRRCRGLLPRHSAPPIKADFGSKKSVITMDTPMDESMEDDCLSIQALDSDDEPIIQHYRPVRRVMNPPPATATDPEPEELPFPDADDDECDYYSFEEVDFEPESVYAQHRIFD